MCSEKSQTTELSRSFVKQTVAECLRQFLFGTIFKKERRRERGRKRNKLAIYGVKSHSR